MSKNEYPECLRPAYFAYAPEDICSYNKFRVQRLLVAVPPKGTRIGKTCATLLSTHGFRRSGSFLYRPECPSCNACVAVRVRVKEFVLDRTFKRCLKKNSDLTRRISKPYLSEESYELLRKYLFNRHGSFESAESPEEVIKAYVESAGETEFFEYRDATGKLVMVSINDIFSDGLSAVYTFYDPERLSTSIGTYSILRQIEETKNRGLPYLYLGYWIKDVPNMQYKARFKPLERFHEENWLEFEENI